MTVTTVIVVVDAPDAVTSHIASTGVDVTVPTDVAAPDAVTVIVTAVVAVPVEVDTPEPAASHV